MAGAGVVVASPGIPPDAPVLRALAERGVRWISEPELAARFYTGSLIAVTGTNGKTTTTLLVDHLLR
ncbi:MAG: UDP-N-acetylmuramoyl-L-alanine--D-glutamate ligase, partial [Gemmatimonadetes bacterium]|nr:UDP-N-acetylmuramoyl-L-alanine--D-glutamate ligase [Gemmatimonadota bacterium]NIX44054.1 UDP-N-acetylmuramoyl-L-alanine--D-glutamate ligase [Gemmatimonadota bacterium]NIY08266.1 UDP-N-acetylmuramoyl-L-alanine--D-glutamate ligase [Gemmatimonadota bacterium]